MEPAAPSLLSHGVPTTWFHIMVETAHASLQCGRLQELSCTLCRTSFLTADSWTVLAIAAERSGVNKCSAHICYRVTPETLPEVWGVIDTRASRLRSTADVTHLIMNSCPR